LNLRVAILLATYNSELYIGEQINSIIDQSYKDWVLYISDDGSIDNTPMIIKEYSCKQPDKIKTLSMNKKFGAASKNFFFLLKNVYADLFFFCDQDDVWDKKKIEKYVLLYEDLNVNMQQKPVLIHSDLTVVSSNLDIIHVSMKEYSFLPKEASNPYFYLTMNNITGCSMCINITCKEFLFEYCNETILEKAIMHDWFLGLITSFMGHIVYIDEPLILYRQHKNNLVGATSFFSMKKILKNEDKKVFVQNLAFFSAFARKMTVEHNKFFHEYFFVQGQSKYMKYVFHKNNMMLKNGFLRKIIQVFRF